MVKSRSPRAETRNEPLCRLLEELGWSVNGFADRVRKRCDAVGQPRAVSRSTVSRWRSGTTPGPEWIGPVCFVLSAGARRQITPRSLGWPADASNIAVDALEYGDLAHAVRALRQLWEVDAVADAAAARRMTLEGTLDPAVLQALVMPPDQDLSGHGTQPVSLADIELLEGNTVLYGGLDARHGGGRFRSTFSMFLDRHAAPLLAGQFADRRGRHLYGCVADAALALGSMAHDDLLPGLAQRYDLQAMRLAQAIGDRGRLARGHIHQARLAAVLGQPQDVLTHARSAVVAAAGAPALVRAYAAVTEARAWAFSGDPERTLAAVEQARSAFSRAGSAADPQWLSWLDRPELEGQAAWALAQAGLAQAGAQALKWAEEMSELRTRDRVELMLTGAELARLLGDEDERAALVARARRASRGLKSRRLASRLERATQGKPIQEF